MTYVDIHGEQGPLCPNIGWPDNPAHILRNRILDSFYKAEPKDNDDEMVEDAAKAYYEAAYGNNTDERMNLYTESRTVLTGTSFITVEVWWFKCHICGLILPANRSSA